MTTEQHKEKARENAMTWVRKNRDKKRKQNREFMRAWRSANLEKAHEREKIWRSANLEKIRERDRAFYHANREKRYESNRTWIQANPEKMRSYKQAYIAGNLNARIANSLRARIRLPLKTNTEKAGKTIELVGCDINWLKAWLEVHFQPGMIWENWNYLTWHIDHIRPCATFDLTDPHQQRLCFHWTNLQPLWAAENLSKGANWNQAQAA
jgi:hypothetical protein